MSNAFVEVTPLDEQSGAGHTVTVFNFNDCKPLAVSRQDAEKIFALLGSTTVTDRIVSLAAAPDGHHIRVTLVPQ